MAEQQRETGRQELFNLMRQEHGVTCMESELTDIEQCVLSYALSHAEGEASGPDYLMDALDNLVHDNYERGYRGAQNRQEDAELIRCALRRSHPAPQVAVPNDLRQRCREITEWHRTGVVKQNGALAALAATLTNHHEIHRMRQAEIETANEAFYLLAAAPTAPAGETVTRCTAGCDETGRCDAAASGEHDLCERRTMPPAPAGEPWIGSKRRADLARQLREYSQRKDRQPVSDPDGLTTGWRDEFDQFWDAQTQGSNAWTTLERLAALDAWQHALEWLVQQVPAPDEREIAGLREDAERWRHVRMHLPVIKLTSWGYPKIDCPISPETGTNDIPAWLDGTVDAARLRAGKEGE